jgi:predicted nucleotidyltransferase
VWLVGSLAIGGFRADSDIDLLVEGMDPLQAATAAQVSCERTAVPVDVIRAEELSPEWRRYHSRFGRLLHG